MIARLRGRPEWAFFGAVRRAAPVEAIVWWAVLVVRGALPPMIGVVSGWLIDAITDGRALTAPLTAMAIVFVAAQVVGPLHEALGYDVGDRTSTLLNDRLMRVDVGPAGHRPPRASGPRRPTCPWPATSTSASPGPPLSYSMNFIADGLVAIVVGSCRRSCWRSPGGGRRSCSSWRGAPPTGCCASRGCGGTATPRPSSAPSGTPTTTTASPSTPRRPRRCACSDWPTG